MKAEITYKDAGVDIDAGDRLVENIKRLAKKTSRPEIISGIGGFGALFSGKFKGYRDPVLVSATDGVGTKLKLAFMMNRHDTIGIDLVAMNVNDIITSGAEPLFFLDYFATGKLNISTAKNVIKGIVNGCEEAGCALIGGETAEMPGIYNQNEYDLAGFAVGVVERKGIISGSSIKPGDSIIGIASSGLHSNGYSLARKVLFDELQLKPESRIAGFKKSLGEELLTPTRIYVKTIMALKKRFAIKGIAHITGGGFIENIPRILPDNYKAVIYKNKWEVSFIFKFIQNGGRFSETEMFRTFNCGIGMVIVVSKGDTNKVITRLKGLREKAYLIGEVAKKNKGESSVIII